MEYYWLTYSTRVEKYLNAGGKDFSIPDWNENRKKRHRAVQWGDKLEMNHAEMIDAFQRPLCPPVHAH